MNVISIPVVIMMSITFYVGISHLMIYSRRKEHPEDLSFALMCFAMGMYDVFCCCNYNVISPHQGIFWQRLQIASLAMTGLFFLLFIFDYTAIKPKKWIYGLYAFLMFTAIYQVSDRSGLFWLSDIPAIKHIQLPFGLGITYYEMKAGPFMDFMGIVAVVFVLYTFWICIKMFLGGQRKKAKPLIWAMLIITAGIINDAAINSGVYKFIYMIEYAYAAIVLLMTYTLVRDVVESAKRKDALEESEAEILRLNQQLENRVIERTSELAQTNESLVNEIEERKNAEQALIESEERYRQLVNHAPAGICEVEFKHRRFVSTNDLMCEYCGYSREEMLTMSPLDILTEHSQKLFLDRIQSIFNGESFPESVEYKVRRKDGGERWVLLNTRVVYEDGAPEGATVVVHDMTERKQMEIELRQSEERYRLLAENVHDVIWIRNLSLRITYISPSVERLRGYSTHEVFNQSIEEALTPESYKQAMNIFLEEVALEESGGLDDPFRYRIFETENICKDGSTVWTEETITFVRDKDGIAFGILGVSRDITDRKQAESERKSYELRLNQAQKLEAIGTLAGGIAHDFNNILSAIIGYTELAKSYGKLSDKARANLEQVLKAGDRAKDLVQQILTFSRHVESERKPVQIHLIIKEALKLLRSSLPSTIEIVQKIDTSSGAVLADSTQIHQVIMNLCTNAFQAMEEQGGILEISLFPFLVDDDYAARHPQLTAGPYLKLTISDTGCGMDTETVGRIFDPFFTTKSKEKGTGLGLATVHGIVASFKGAITVYSEPKHGTTFTLYLPRFGEEGNKAIKSDESVPRGSGEHILIVDDEPALLEITMQMLEQLDYKVTPVSESIQALELFRKTPNSFDLVLTDQTMPKMMGTQLALEMVKIRPDIPVVLTTGFSESSIQEGENTDAIARLVEKPYNHKMLGEAISKVLNPKSEQVNIL